MLNIVLLLLLLSTPAFAQEPAPAPSLTPSEEGLFAAARGMAVTAQVVAMETREYRAYQKALDEMEKRRQAYMAKRATLPQWKAYVAFRAEFEAMLKRRGVVINFDTGALSPAKP